MARLDNALSRRGLRGTSGEVKMAPDAEALPRARRFILWDGVCTKLMDTFTGGVFLAGLGLFVGANNFTIGILAALPFLAQVAQVGAVQLLQRIQDRRRVVVMNSFLARTALFVIAGLLLLRPAWLHPWILVLLLAWMALLAVVSTAAWNWWIRDVLPRNELGRYFGRRLQLTTLIGVVGLLLAGAVLDRFVDADRTTDGYALLFVLGGVAGYAGLFFLQRTPHPPPHSTRLGGSVLRQMMRPLREERNRRLVLALALVAPALTLALPFTAVFLLRSVGYGFLAVTSLALVSQLAYVGGLRGWGYLSDRYGNRPVLKISLGILVASLLGWAVAWTDRTTTLFLTLLLLHFLGGFSVGGIELTAGNILLKSAPEVGAPAYLASMSLLRASTAGAATLLAGLAWQVIGTDAFLVFHGLPGAVWSVRGFHVLAAASALFGGLAFLALHRVEEEGGAPVFEVARAMRREVRMISSVAGIRAFVHVVSYMVEFLASKQEPRDTDAATGKAAEPGANVLPRQT